jgi:hypothetical protein
MITELDVNWCYPLTINKVGGKEVLTQDVVKNGKYTRTGGIAVEIKFNDNPTQGRILLFNVSTSHKISIEKQGEIYHFNSGELLNDCFNDGKEYYQECSVNSQSMVFQDFAFFQLEETWSLIKYDLAFTSYIVHEQNDKLIPISSFNWFLKADCARDGIDLWQLTNSVCSNLSDILESQIAYTADGASIDFRRLNKLFDTVERWRAEMGV